jgi:uncharacterized protein with beta-barrel porin domain
MIAGMMSYRDDNFHLSKRSHDLRAGVAARALAVGATAARDVGSCNVADGIATRRFARRVTAAFAAIGLLVVCPISPSHAQAPPLGSAQSFGVLAASAITNTGPTVINGNLGISPNNLSSVTGFTFSTIPGPGVVNGSAHLGDAVAAQAQLDITAAYNALFNMPIAHDLTGQDLGGKTLTAGVYGFNAAAQLTGTLTLNGQGNPNSVFIINIGSALTTASASHIVLINGAQGANVFFTVGSSATLGTGTQFVGDILALTSITLNTAASIDCGAAFARNGAVTLDTNLITICAAMRAAAASVLPTSASGNQMSVANAIDGFVANGGTLPPAFQTLLSTLSPSDLAAAFTQLSGEAATGTAQAGTQAMDSFLAMMTSPFAGERGFAENPPPPRSPLITKAPVYKASAAAETAPDPRRWSIWAAGYGNQGTAAGDAAVGSHDRWARTFGYATGLDYRITPHTVVGFALAGGGTNYGLSDGLGGGHSDLFQAAVYSFTRVNAAYVSAALAYGWSRVTTDRYVTLLGTDHLTADFSTNNIGGRIEGGYRFAIPGVYGLPGRYGITPYAAGQAQAFRTPSYSESAASGSSVFALAYDAHTTTTARSELGAWLDWNIPVDYGTALTLRTRAAWAHDYWSATDITAMFQALPGSSFTVTGAAPAKDLLLASAGAELGLRHGWSLAAWFDGEFAEGTQRYAGTGRLRYMW